MRDIIWTLIIVWLIYRIVDLFKIGTSKKAYNETNTHANTQNASRPASKPEKDIKNAIKKHLNNEGEYVDFEEVK